MAIHLPTNIFACRRAGAQRSLGVLILGFLILQACGRAPDHFQRAEGNIMGTVFHVTANCPTEVGAAIVAELERVDRAMSTYSATSELSRFNRAPTGRWVGVSNELVHVVAAAAELSAISGGAFDVTVGPLVNLWGFGPEPAPAHIPDSRDIDRALQRIGYGYLEYRHDPPALLKRRAIYVDLSAIAKGFAVDLVAERLEASGCSNYLVEVGGEVRAHGASPRGDPWRVGVEVPEPGSFAAVQRVLPIRDDAVATSGDYRNFIDLDGRRFSHTIDPRSGFPVDHGLASVTVVHASALWADGYATMLSVIGTEAGIEVAEREGLTALFVQRTENGFEERYTSGMQLLLGIR